VLKLNAQNNAIDFKKNLQEKKVSLFATTCSLGQFDEKINHTKISKVFKFWSKGLQGKWLF